MAIVENRATHVVDLTGGRMLAPHETANVDPELPHEAALIAAGLLVVVDPSTPPPVDPVDPHAVIAWYDEAVEPDEGDVVTWEDGRWVPAPDGGGALAFPIERYGAVVDGRMVVDAAISSGSAALSSASAAFTSADVGKVVLVNGAGAGGNPLRATISSVSGGVATLSTTASSTVTGATAFYGTDDTAAIQDAIDACVMAGGGDVVSPAGIAIVDGIVQLSPSLTLGSPTGLSYRAQLTIPAVDVEGHDMIPLRFRGATTASHPSGRIVRPGGDFELAAQMSTWLSTRTGGEWAADDGIPAMLGGPDPDSSPTAANEGGGGWYAGYTNVSVEVERMMFRGPANPTYTLCQFRLCGVAKVRLSKFATTAQAGEITEPTAPTGMALMMPQLNNLNVCSVNDVEIIGFYGGAMLGEHVTTDNLIVFFCKVAIIPIAPANHALRIGYTCVEACTYALGYVHMVSGVGDPPSAVPVDISCLDIEDVSGGWWLTAHHIRDNGSFRGQVGYYISNDSPLLIDGSTQLKLINLQRGAYVHVVGAAGEPAFQNSWSNFTSTFQHSGLGATAAAPPVAFYKDASGVVHLTGLVNGGTTPGIAFTLPVGFRPAGNVGPPVQGAPDVKLGVDVNGNVIVQSVNPLWLDGVSFLAAA